MVLIASSKQKKILFAGVGIALLLAIGGVVVMLSARNASPSGLVTYVVARTSSGIDAHLGGHPIDSGYEPQMLMDTYPGFVSGDFDGVQATQGRYFIDVNGTLAFSSTAGNTVSTAGRGLTNDGIMHVLQNAAARLSLPLASEKDVDALLARLGVSASGDISNIPVSAAKVPEGWYSHQSAGYDGGETILTKTKDLPKADPNNYGYGEHIAIVERDIGISPEEYVKWPWPTDAPGIHYAAWGTLFGRKMFSTGFTDANDGSKQQSMYLFGDGHVIMVNLYPDKQENRAAFQQVVNYYAQTLPMIPRTETFQACKTVNLPPGQEYDIMGDPETGYVTVGYWPNSEPGMGTMATYAFLNYNDDLSQCTSSVKKELERAKVSASKMTQ